MLFTSLHIGVIYYNLAEGAGYVVVAPVGLEGIRGREGSERSGDKRRDVKGRGEEGFTQLTRLDHTRKLENCHLYLNDQSEELSSLGHHSLTSKVENRHQ